MLFGRQSTKPEWTHLHLKSLTEQVVVAETEQMRMAYHPKREGRTQATILVELAQSVLLYDRKLSEITSTLLLNRKYKEIDAG